MAENVMCWMTSAQTPAPAIAATRPAAPRERGHVGAERELPNCSPRWT